MNYKLCGRFDTLRKYLPDELNISSSFDFHGLGNIRNYCPNGDSGGKECYMLTLKKDHKINNLKEFYEDHIKNNTYYINCDNNGEDCGKSLKEATEYANYKEIIDQKMDLLNINFEDIAKFYFAFKLLCEMYYVFAENTSNCKNCSKNVNQFVEKYNKINKDYNNTDSSPYRKILSTLSADYNRLKDKCQGVEDSHFPTLQTIEEKQPDVQRSGGNYRQSSEPISEVASSSSSIVSKLIPVLLIFGAIPIFWGISYKYSLFGFRKRSPKQHLREMVKK
ncbi:hypothetical protein, variant [Plasmodium yoelii 17X]|uniref:Plasmodium variant antigen protein Cir/Yir/Bir n=1 Tax=Plasmodium yoelii 17X TaxID=1323249 RepID=V7PJY9_PLAYE|nr:hypothetical protein, variant [Plasmodium yoelii 17X]